MSQDARRVFVTVGTDHHRFDRLVNWMEEWDPPNHLNVAVFVQHGRSRAPSRFETADFLDAAELRGQIGQADVVVTQGGPGGIMDSLRSGCKPIVVARQAALGEHVDDHQVAFVMHMAARGTVLAASNSRQFHHHLTSGVLDPALLRTVPLAVTPAETIQSFASAIDDVVRAPRTGWRQRLPRRLIKPI